MHALGLLTNKSHMLAEPHVDGEYQSKQTRTKQDVACLLPGFREAPLATTPDLLAIDSLLLLAAVVLLHNYLTRYD